MSMEPASEFTDPHQVELAAALGFNPGDLVANRQGTLTARQIALLRRDQRRRTWPSVIAAGILATAIVALAVIGLAATMDRLLAAAVAILLAMYTVGEARAAVQPIGSGPDQVKACRWRIDDQWRPARRLGVIEFQVDSQWFSADRALAACLRAGQCYTLYYYSQEWSYPGAAITASRSGRFSVFARYGSFRILSIEAAHRGG